MRFIITTTLAVALAVTFSGCSSVKQAEVKTPGTGPVIPAPAKTSAPSPTGEDKRFFDAVNKDDTATITAMLKIDKKYLTIKDAKNSTPLIAAANNGKLKSTATLIKSGAAVDATDGFGRTALHAAASHNYLEIAKLLISSGADVNARSKSLGTPLHAAAVGGSVEIADFLLKKGASIDATTKRGITPLIAALSKGGHKQIAKFLLDKGAKFDPGKLAAAMTGKKGAAGSKADDSFCCENL